MPETELYQKSQQYYPSLMNVFAITFMKLSANLKQQFFTS